MFYMAGKSEDLSLDAASQINWETAPKRQIGEPRCIGVFATETRELEHQKISVNERKPHISNYLALFCVWEDTRVWKC